MNQLHLFEDPEAINTKNFTIYRASAGSGKTFTLVKEYLKIVLRNPSDYQHILAITFTNKATEEMKRRILEHLIDLSAGKSTDMRHVIEKEVRHYEQKLNIQDRAKKALTNILHNYSRFSISTIDHFFSQLVRALARELKLSLNYQIDVDDDTAMKESLLLLYQNLTHDEELRGWAKDFAFSKIDNDKGWQLDYTLLEFGKELFKEKFHQGFSKISREEVNIKSLRELEQDLQNTEREFASYLKELAGQAKKLIAAHGLSKENFKGKSNGVANTFDKILFNNFKLTDTFKNVAQGTADWYTQKSPDIARIDGVVKAGLGKIALEIYQYHAAHHAAYVTAKQLQRHIYSYGLLDAISEQLKTYRQSNNLMLLSHNSFLLREIISDHEAPFLFEKLGSYYQHVLIDEFQDTSVYQWENVKPLITNSLDHNHHVLLVGDVKQSIYRWRGGDLNLLLNQAVDDLSLYRDQLQVESLQINRRSAGQVVAFNNQFFTLASQLLLATKDLPDDSTMLSEVYREVEQEPGSSSNGGVCIKFFERNEGQWRNEALKFSTSVIREHVVETGNYSDFLVLCDTNLEVSEVSQHLSTLGIPVDSEQALSLSSYWAVRLLVSGMYLLVDARDSLARAEMACLYQKGVQAEDLDFNELFMESCSVGSGLLEKYLPAALVEQWDELSSRNIYEWASQVIPLLIESKKADPFLTRFLDVCLEQNAKGKTTARDFINWWEVHKEQQMVVFPSHQEAVRVMTIHKAKGLESPIVLIPWADFELKPRKDNLFWTDELSAQFSKYKLLPLSFSSELMDSYFSSAYQQELLEGLTEGLNTVYVAFTRARQRLYVNSIKPTRSIAADDLAHLYKLLWEICNHPGWESCWDAQSSTFIKGDLSESVPKTKQEIVPTIAVDQMRMAPYANKVTIRSENSKMFTLLDNYHARNIREGLQVHAVLERMSQRSDLETVLNQLTAEGVVKKEDHDGVRGKVEGLFDQPDFSAFFQPGWKVFSEMDIASMGRRYTPDRVITNQQRTIVVDYKREKENPEHGKQIKGYAAMLEKMGYRQVEMFLVYVGEAKIVQV
ncbi:MAG: DNA helicase [Cyclobacteriaceae bacterium]|nr:MAG: DNA helicase [Cyclobacteriaceae bacterium]